MKKAFGAYHGSEVMCNTHARIKDSDFKIPGRNFVLDKVVSLVRMSRIDDVDLSGAVGSIPGSKLERAEEWSIDVVFLPDYS